MIDSDTVNELNNEQYHYAQYEREQKNRIRSIVNTDRKQKEWSRMFPMYKSDDSWMLTANVF